MSIKKLYYYFFYKIYKSIEYTSENFGGKFLSSFKAGFVMIVLQIWLLLSIGNYYSFITNEDVELSISMPIIYIPLIIIIGFNYFTLDFKDYWIKYFKEFDKLPKEKNKKYGMIVWSIIILIIGNMLFSFYLLFAQAKKNQTGPYAPEIVAKEKMEDSLQKAQQIEKLKKIYGEDKK